MKKITKTFLKEVYKTRPANARKYDFGLLLVIGGSEFYSGAPALSALAAFRSGVDMVRIIAPKRAADIMASFSPNLAAYPLEGDKLNKGHLSILFSMTEAAKSVARGRAAVVIGGGTGRTPEIQELILEYLRQIDIPAVIDADAIHALAKDIGIIKGKNFLITPHSYEFSLLTGKEVADLSEEKKAELVNQEAQRLGATLLLKGKTDFISDGSKIAAETAGSPFMTVGGTGDALAGIAGALLARGLAPFEAGCAAALINGLAGEKAAKKLGEGMTATDLIEEIPNVIR